MSETILNETKSHYTGGPVGDSNDDVFPVTIPNGFRYVSTNFNILEKTGPGGDPSGAAVVEEPSFGQTGVGRIKVHWYYNAFSKVRYNIKALADPLPQNNGGSGNGGDNPPDPETGIFESGQKSHASNWLVIGDKGDDNIPVDLPAGFSFESARLDFAARRNSGADITQQPAPGSSGALAFTVHWWCDAFADLRYKLVVTARKKLDFGLELEELTLSPNPARAGRDVTITARVRNVGQRRIDGVAVTVAGTVTHLDDLRDNILNALTEAQRTRESTENINLGLDPGMRSTIVRTRPVAAAITSGISSAGTYRLRVTVRTSGGISLGTKTLDFSVTR